MVQINYKGDGGDVLFDVRSNIGFVSATVPIQFDFILGNTITN